MRFVYFVSYDFKTKNGHLGFGNKSINSEGEIDSIDDIRAIEKIINEEMGHEVTVVNNYLLLRVEGVRQ